MPARTHYVCTFPGCGKPLAVLQVRERHGLCRDPLYSVWCAIKSRTSDPSHESYRSYGARGIRLHTAWQRFGAFHADITADIGPRPGAWPDYQLDRIDNDGHYEPGNLRWSTPAENARNKRAFTLVPTAELAALRAELEVLRAGA